MLDARLPSKGKILFYNLLVKIKEVLCNRLSLSLLGQKTGTPFVPIQQFNINCQRYKYDL